MANFLYKARDYQGLPVNGVVEADSELVVASNLRHLGYRVVSIQKEALGKKQLEKFFQRFHRVPPQDIILFSRQLSAMLKSGIPLTSALNSITQQVKSEELLEAFKKIIKDLEGGSSFSQSISRYPKIFNDLFVSMIKVGEATGMLPQILDRLVSLMGQELEVKNRVRSALIYPTILVILTVMIVAFLMTVVIPKFIVVFESYDAKLPLPTQILLAVSGFLKTAGIFIIFGLAGGMMWLKQYLATEKGRYHLHTALLKWPIVGTFYVKVVVSRFARTLGVLVRSGIPILEALTVTEKTVNNVVLSRVITNIRSAVSEGQSLTEPFKTSGIFPPMVIQMISAGEKSGRLDQMLDEISLYYEQEIEYAIKNVTTTLEPLLLVVMGGMVAFVALAVLGPIFNLIKVFRGNL